MLPAILRMKCVWLGLAFATSLPVHAANLPFRAAIVEVQVDAGTSRYSGLQVGDSFGGDFNYGDSAAQAAEIVVEDNEQDWTFVGGTFGASLTDGTNAVSGALVAINVQNDVPLEADELAAFSAVPGASAITAGTPVDVWTAGSIELGATFIADPTPEDPENESLANGVAFELAFVFLDTTVFADTSFRVMPPASGALAGAILNVVEADASGNIIFSAIAVLSEPGPIFSSLLPISRAVATGSLASVFATVINGGLTGLTGCRISPATTTTSTFLFQTTDSMTNAVTGTPNAPVDLAPDGMQTFVLVFTPSAAFLPTDINLDFVCDDGVSAAPISGVNTLLLSASDTPGPDVIALVASVLPGQVVLDRVTGAAAFAVATANVGVAGDVTVEASSNSPVTIAICETNTMTGACINPVNPVVGTVATTIGAGATPSFAVFPTANVLTDTIPFDPAVNRVFLRVRDSSGNVIGATSVAVSKLQ